MLTPADIENKQFGTTRLKEGYDQDEVDGFLDQCGAALEDLHRKLADAEQRVRVLQAQNQRLTEAPTSVQAAASPSAVAEKLIAAAQTAAEQHESEAKAKAEQLVNTAKLDADRLVNDAGAKSARMIEQATDAANKIESDARAEAERIKNDGYAEKYKKFEDLEKRHNALAAAVNDLDARGRQIREALHQAIDRYDSGVPNSGS
jgi:DivIVA domain-containing protein